MEEFINFFIIDNSYIKENKNYFRKFFKVYLEIKGFYFFIDRKCGICIICIVSMFCEMYFEILIFFKIKWIIC